MRKLYLPLIVLLLFVVIIGGSWLRIFNEYWQLVFLFMGINTLSGTDFYARLKLWLTDRNLYPDTHYVRHVPWKVIHVYTFIQLFCLVVLWILKSSPAGILFPLFIAMLVPLRLLLNRWFEPEHLALLDAAEQSDDDSMGDFRP